jgi:hypothetical protein
MRIRGRFGIALSVPFLAIQLALGQGTILFDTSPAAGINVRIFQPNNITPLAGAGYTAQVLGGQLGAPEASLTPLLPSTTFLSGAEAGYVVPVIVELPGIPEGGAASLLLRVWANGGSQIGSFEEAQLQGVLHGQSAIFDVVGLGGSTLPPVHLIGLQSFTLIPEPLALWWLALLALMVFLWQGQKAAEKGSNRSQQFAFCVAQASPPASSAGGSLPLAQGRRDAVPTRSRDGRATNANC